MIAADISGSAPAVIDPVPAVIDPEAWEELSAGLIQRALLLDALYADLYGPRTIFETDVAPTAELLADPAYLRPVSGMPRRGSHHLFALSCTVMRTADGHWAVLEDTADVPDGAGTALEVRRALSRCAPGLYRSTPLHRLHPFFDGIRSALHQRARRDGRAGRPVVLADESDPLRAFDHHWFANLLGAPVVAASDLQSGSGTLALRLPGLESDPGDAVDAVIRLVPSHQVDPLDLGPTPLGGVTGLVEAARCGDVEVLNPLGAGILESAALRSSLPDLCRQILHEDLMLRSPSPGELPEAAGWLSMDPAGGEELVERPLQLRLQVVAGEDGFEVLPGGVARTVDSGTETFKDVWVAVPETSGASGSELEQPSALLAGPRHVLAAPSAMTRSTGSDLFWFGRYLERVDSTTRLLRTVMDSVNDLRSERGPAPRIALSVLLRAVTDVTTTFPGFHEIDLRDREAVQAELTGLLSDLGRPGSLAQSFTALTHTTRTLRDLVTDDVWPVIARMRSRLRSLDPDSSVPLEQGLSEIIDSCLTLSGAAADAMPRNLGWDLTEVGRKIERSLSLLTLVRAALGRRRTRAAEARIAGALASVTESGASYRRSYHAALQPELLLDLLLSDPTLPRSIIFQLDRLGGAIDRLPEVSPTPELRAPLTAVRTRVESWSARELLHPLDESEGAPTLLLEEADAAVTSLRELATAVENRFFGPSESASLWGIDDV